MNKFDLEIILITFNRLPFLKRTMEFIFNENSPIKNFPITVLDNSSTDGTADYLQTLSIKYNNLKVVRNKVNIGGNLNIARAFEIASHTYFWILCDDDTYNWEHWTELEDALSKKPDLVIVNTELTKRKLSFPEMMRLLTFVPASVYRKESVLPFAIKNIYYNAKNWFPHLAAVCEIVNKEGKIHALKNNLILAGKQVADPTFSMKSDKTLAPKTRLIFFEIGYLASLSMLNDAKKRADAVEHFCVNSHSFLHNIMSVCKQNIIENEDCFNNYAQLFDVCNFWQKIRLCFAIIVTHLRFYLLYPKYNKRRKNYSKRVEESNNIS